MSKNSTFIYITIAALAYMYIGRVRVVYALNFNIWVEILVAIAVSLQTYTRLNSWYDMIDKLKRRCVGKIIFS